MPLVIPSYINELVAYVPGEFEEGAVKLSSNENPLGCSPLAREAYKEAADKLHLYPDGGCNALRQSLADHHGLQAENIVVGCGSDEIIRMLFQIFVQEGGEVVYPEYDFLMYPLSAQVNGGVKKPVKEMNFHIDPHQLVNELDEQTKMVIFSNPHVPTGSYLSYDHVAGLVSLIPDDVLVVLDSAYAEYMEGYDDYHAGHELVERYDNVVVLRTFSKAYGLAALRIGWAHGSKQIIDALNKVRGAFNVTMPAQVAAVAALNDQDFVKKSVEHNAQVRDDFIVKMVGLGFKVYPSCTNFVLVDFGTVDRANIVRDYLRENKVIVRPMGFYNLGHCLRISIGVSSEMDLVVNLLKEMV